MKELRFSQIGTIVRHHLRLFIIIFVLSFLIFLTIFISLGLEQQSNKPPIGTRQYTARAELLVFPIHLKRIYDGSNGLYASPTILSFGDDYVKSDQVIDEYINSLNPANYVNDKSIGYSINSFNNLIEATGILIWRDSYKVIIEVASPNASLAADLVNNIAKDYDNKMKEYASIFRAGLERIGSSTNNLDSVIVDDGGVLSIHFGEFEDDGNNYMESIQHTSIINSKMVIVSILLGMLIAFLAVTLKFFISDEFYDVDELKDFGYSLLGWLSFNKTDKEFDNNGNLAINKAVFMQKEFVPVASKILHKMSKTQNNLLGVISPSTGEGKSSLAIQLSRYSNQTGRASLLIQVENRKKMSDYSITDVLKTGESNLELFEHLKFMVNSEGIAILKIYEEDYAELINVNKASKIFKVLANEFEYIIIDFPAYFTSSSKVMMLLEVIDNYVLIIQARKSSLSLTRALVSDLDERSKTILGFVYNGANPRLASKESEMFKQWKLGVSEKV